MAIFPSSDPLSEFLSLPFPEERIALTLNPFRDRSLLVVERRSRRIEALPMTDLPRRVRPGDLWVVNASQVVPALSYLERVQKKRKTECLWIRPREKEVWEVFLFGKKIREGEVFRGEEGLTATVLQRVGKGFLLLSDRPPLPWLAKYGLPPLPPYIRKNRKKKGMEEILLRDREDYQNPQGRVPGSIAASTAAFHITPEIRKACEERGARFCEIILHIGPSTFAELSQDTHSLPPEYAEIPEQTFHLLHQARSQRGRIVAVGTTVVRTLEALMGDGSTPPSPRDVDLVITPGYRFKWVDALLTNFHLPHTTLRLLIASFAGAELALRAYEKALSTLKFHFYSYGDAMWIE
jgi:S-adenosylmethionine:tRNA ribosyltransferase-isomerase